jgi:hypothetical protein
MMVPDCFRMAATRPLMAMRLSRFQEAAAADASYHEGRPHQISQRGNVP